MRRVDAHFTDRVAATRDVRRPRVEPVAPPHQRSGAVGRVQLVPGQLHVVDVRRCEIDGPVRREMGRVQHDTASARCATSTIRDSGSTSPVTFDAPVIAGSVTGADSARADARSASRSSRVCSTVPAARSTWAGSVIQVSRFPVVDLWGVVP